MLHLDCALLASPSPKGKRREKVGRIVQEKNGFTQGPEKSIKKVSVETEVYKAKGGMSFLLHVVGSIAYCQQMWWMLRVDVVSECNETDSWKRNP